MSERRKPYPFDILEPKWQARWEEGRLFRAQNPGEPGFDATRPKFYVLDMFPYPSGAGLHVGHPEGYTATDIVARYKRFRGFNVLHPIGWDAFGLPAEQYAIKTGQHPEVTTRENIARFKKQLKRIGFSYDWERELSTADPDFYRWTQWIFLQIYNSWFNPESRKAEPISTYTGDDPDSVRLAYVAEVPVNWCPELGTVLANEEVIDGKSEVGGFPVVRRPMRQWMLRITAYAERLIEELEPLAWPEGIKLLQRNWIGRSEGAEIDFKVARASSLREDENGELEARPTIRVFTTRPDTLYGGTYLVLAPEHPLVDLVVPETQREDVHAYREQATRKSDLERAELTKEKTGVFSGAYAINPASEEKIPIWIADYVLLGYGTGAIGGVPAHDERDLEFARKYNLPIKVVVRPKDRAEPIGFFGEGIAVNSPLIDGLPSTEAKEKMTTWLEERGQGKRAVNYKLRDWLFSRQRYWGEPFPIVWENGKHRSLGEDELPIVPPPLADYKPTGTGEPPLAKATDWIRYSETASRELNTMPQWAGSCWYYLRFCDPRNAVRFCGSDAESYWMSGRTWRATEDWPMALTELYLEAVVEMGRRPNRQVEFAPVSETLAEKVRAVSGLEIAGFWHVLDVSTIRYIHNQHGWFEVENARGQIPVTSEDLKLLPMLLSKPDSVEFSARWSRGMKRFVITKRINGRVYIVEEVRGRRSQMRIVTFYQKKVATTRDVAPKAPLSVTSEADRRVNKIATPFATRNTGGVDLYVGGTEHAVLHLLYARFWHKVLFDLGYLTTNEPFQRLVNQGVILGEDGRKMSKRWGNVIDPLDVIAELGDAFRCYEMFMGPLEQMKPWSMTGVEGVARFLARVWRLTMEENQAGEWVLSPAVHEVAPTHAQEKVIHATIKKVGEDIEALSFNTAIAQMMIFVNAFTTAETRSLTALRTLLVLLNPFAPHLTSELWETLGRRFPISPNEITDQPWPTYDPALLIENEVEIVLQVNGKVRDRIMLALGASEKEVKAAALANERVREFTAEKTIRKVVVVQNKLVNIVAN